MPPPKWTRRVNKMRSVEALARAEGVSVEEFMDRVCDCDSGSDIVFEADFEVEDDTEVTEGDTEDPEATPEEGDADSESRRVYRV